MPSFSEQFKHVIGKFHRRSPEQPDRVEAKGGRSLTKMLFLVVTLWLAGCRGENRIDPGMGILFGRWIVQSGLSTATPIPPTSEPPTAVPTERPTAVPHKVFIAESGTGGIIPGPIGTSPTPEANQEIVKANEQWFTDALAFITDKLSSDRDWVVGVYISEGRYTVSVYTQHGVPYATYEMRFDFINGRVNGDPEKTLRVIGHNVPEQVYTDELSPEDLKNIDFGLDEKGQLFVGTMIPNGTQAMVDAGLAVRFYEPVVKNGRLTEGSIYLSTKGLQTYDPNTNEWKDVPFVQENPEVQLTANGVTISSPDLSASITITGAGVLQMEKHNVKLDKMFPPKVRDLFFADLASVVSSMKDFKDGKGMVSLPIPNGSWPNGSTKLKVGADGKFALQKAILSPDAAMIWNGIDESGAAMNQLLQWVEGDKEHRKVVEFLSAAGGGGGSVYYAMEKDASGAWEITQLGTMTYGFGGKNMDTILAEAALLTNAVEGKKVELTLAQYNLRAMIKMLAPFRAATHTDWTKVEEIIDRSLFDASHPELTDDAVWNEFTAWFREALGVVAPK